MKSELLKYYVTIGKISKLISSTDNLDEVLKESIAEIMSDSPADYVVVWFTNGEELKPYYWIGDRDFTQLSYKPGDGLCGSVFAGENAVRLLNNGEIAASDFAGDLAEVFGEHIESAVCVPLSSKDETFGCIEFVRLADKSPFCEEEADVLEIFSSCLALKIEESPLVDYSDRFKNPILSARGITKTFTNGPEPLQVLKGVNLDVFEGELLVVLGESGCGKSTFLNIVGGMETCDGGEFYFLGKDMTHATPAELTQYRRKNIGFIFQSYNLMPNLNAKENLDLISELVDNPMDSVEALKLVGLESKKNSYPAMLSGGQQQRISIARALVKRPKLIFADEPTAALDYATSIEVLSVLGEVAKAGTTVVMVTHNETITKMADRVVRMRNGKSYEVTVNKHPLKATDLVW